MLELGGSELYRISRDIDVLVPWDQFDQAIDLLLKHNWEFKEPTSEGAMSIGRINAFALYHPIHRIDIDLHRSLFHDAGNDCFPLMNEIWGRAKKSRRIATFNCVSKTKSRCRKLCVTTTRQ